MIAIRFKILVAVTVSVMDCIVVMFSLILFSRLDCAGAAGGRCWIVARSFVARSITRLLLLAFTNSRPWEWKLGAGFAIQEAAHLILDDYNIGSVGLLAHLAPLIPVLVLPFYINFYSTTSNASLLGPLSLPAFS